MTFLHKILQGPSHESLSHFACIQQLTKKRLLQSATELHGQVPGSQTHSGYNIGIKFLNTMFYPKSSPMRAEMHKEIYCFTSGADGKTLLQWHLFLQGNTPQQK